MSATFTPAPWNIERHPNPGFGFSVMALDASKEAEPGDMRVVASYLLESDARLIAQAPTMYEALKDIVERYEKAIVLSGTDIEFARIATAQFRAVLAEVEGGK